MSLRGKINNAAPDFYKAIQQRALSGKLDRDGGALGTRKIYGYVCRVHDFDDEDDELKGTVDVQEYDYIKDDEDDYIDGAGHHIGVLCSAINNNSDGVWMMPTLFSDVVITQNPKDKREYVLMYSHVDAVQFKSHKTVKIGVEETEEPQEDKEVPDLEKTELSASVDIDKGTILDTIKTKNGTVTIKKTIDGVDIAAQQGTTIHIGSDGNINVYAQKTITIKGGNVVKQGTCKPDGKGVFCGIPVCPFTGAIHGGSTINGIGDK
jgi:hypothetical protein